MKVAAGRRAGRDLITSEALTLSRLSLENDGELTW
jgi:hypothetical protein